MKAAILKAPKSELVFSEIPKPKPKPHEILIKVSACAICRTDLHIIDGDLPVKNFPLILGHQVVGTVEEMGENVKDFSIGDLVGLYWLGSACLNCDMCLNGKENLCTGAKFRGLDLDGGFAEYTLSDEKFATALPPNIPHTKLAPLLCAGLIGYRAYRKADPKKTVGFYGFGSAAHLLIQIALFEKKEVYAFTKENDLTAQKFAKKMGAKWAGSSKERAPELLDAAILFGAAGELIPLSLKAIKKGGRCISAEIHMSDIPSFPYQDLWGEKRIESVANVTRLDAKLYFKLFSGLNIDPKVKIYPLNQINQAIKDLRFKKVEGAAVIDFSHHSS